MAAGKYFETKCYMNQGIYDQTRYYPLALSSDYRLTGIRGAVLGFQVQLSNILEDHCHLHPFKPEFTIVIFIHYKSRTAVAVLDL